LEKGRVFAAFGVLVLSEGRGEECESDYERAEFHEVRVSPWAASGRAISIPSPVVDGGRESRRAGAKLVHGVTRPCR